MRDAAGSPIPREDRIETLIAAFERQFGRRPEGIAEAPGRVNLIGEHVDYNDGLVLPFAIDRSVMCAWARRDDDAIWTYAADMDEHSRFSLANVTHAALGAWANYTRGVVASLQRAGYAAAGIEIAFAGDVPQDAGLSSSAALEVSVAGALRDAFSLAIDDVELARLCQRAENEYVGVQCGIMDQFAAALSKRDHALLIDCRTLTYEHVPLRLEEARLAIVIANSGMKRELASSAYNDRRRECEEAVAMLRERLGRPDLRSLRDVTRAELDFVTTKDERRETIPIKRAMHVIGEITRVRSSAALLKSDEFKPDEAHYRTLGELLFFSHLSLRNNFNVTSPEIDLLCGQARAQDFVWGARLTGAGFGGCTVNLVRADAVDAFERDVIAPYRERTGLPAEMYVTSPQDGLRTWRL